LYFHTVRALSTIGTVYRAEGIERCVADMSRGVEPWLARRSARFRQRWRRRRRDAANAGIEIETVASSDGLMDRFLEIEAAGWKGEAAEGITSPGMQATYREMIDRLAANDRLRAAIATQDSNDVGFILGGVRSGVYRGLQLSYAESVAQLEVGHLLQSHEIERLGDAVHTYDLGMDMEYKRRWADEVRSTVVVIVHRSP
ncbi:MAG: GNAT family N-acetyltransferase, partial [Acidimicrobiales bacterium]|nr:GNAT family N-acetyltransferase [Acidimicrobiales bacterium]